MLKKSKSGFSPHILLPIIAAIAVIGIGGYLAKHYYDVSQERKEFMAAKAEVNKLGEAIAKATNPTKHQASQYCDYGHAKWGPVGRTCWAEYYFSRQVNNEEEAVKVYEQAKTHIRNNVLKIIEFQDGSNRNFSELRGANLKLGSVRKNCSLSIVRNDDSEIMHYTKLNLPGIPFDTEKNSAVIILSCNGEAMAEHFPVRKS